MRNSAPREFVEIGPEVAERMPLEREPSAATVASYVFTRGASLAWESINKQLKAGQGELFWVGGAAGAGKTHFLNYVLALSLRAGAINAETARHITLPIEITDGSGPGEIDRHILEAISVALTGDRHAPSLWRQMRGAEALTIALDNARRQGVKGIMVALDLGRDETPSALDILLLLSQIARGLKQLRLIVVASGRGAPPPAGHAFNVAPHTDEEIPVAVGRARHLSESASGTVEELYRNLEAACDVRAIYPLHPAAAGALRSLHAPNGAVGALAKAVREVIEQWHVDRDFRRLIMPAALMRSPTLRRVVDARLGEAGRTALKIASDAVASKALATDEIARATIQTLIDTLVLIHLSGASGMLPLDEIRARMDLASLNGASGTILAEWLAVLAGHTHGVILYDAQTRAAGFNPLGAGSSEVTAFNSALPLICRFDSSMTLAQTILELKAKITRLNAALAAALEEACRHRKTLTEAMRESNVELSPAQDRAFANFIGLTERGAEALIEAGNDRTRCDAALTVIALYEALASVAESIPRLKRMREYLTATRLEGVAAEEAGRDRSTVELETECQMLAIALNPSVLAGGGRNLDALEARFQKFKWAYVQQYRTAHDQCRDELKRLAPVVIDAHRHIATLERLNSITALGAAMGIELSGEMRTLDTRLSPCAFEGALAPEISPCCPSCGYLIGTISPRQELNDLGERTHRAVQSKLAALAQSAIGRLIHLNDNSHRLEGFLKIVQAAQTEALIDVLDDDLANYLAKLLEEKGTITDGISAGVQGMNAGHADVRQPEISQSQMVNQPMLGGRRPQRSKAAEPNGQAGRAAKGPPDVTR